MNLNRHSIAYPHKILSENLEKYAFSQMAFHIKGPLREHILSEHLRNEDSRRVVHANG